ncbi:hypothetical protein [Solimonas flava]|uniref:hypothetical protein n=1 Tax=Solimonas flava TaxID=415849 RepID=UPI00041D8B46|nr:hypothetical protein [Solimonas flava]
MFERTWKSIGIVALLVLAACGGSGGGHDDDGNEPPPAGVERPGLGDSRAAPQGAPFALPAGVEVAGPIKGYSVFTPENCAPQEPSQGVGDLVRICLPLRNTTDTIGNPLPITVTIPPGFVAIAEDLHTQNGVLVQKQAVLIEPGRTIYLPLYLFCLNASRSGSSPQDTFQLGPILRYADFQELFDLLKDKELDRDAPQAELQGAVWRLSEGDPLSVEDRAYIAALPARSSD